MASAQPMETTMDILAIYDSVDDIPADVNFSDLFSERNGKMELTGIAGVKTQGDVDRLTGSLASERTAHRTTKDAASVWGDMNPDDVQTQLDRIPELEAAAGDRLDQAGIDQLVEKRLAGTLKTKTQPLDRKIVQLERANAELATQNAAFLTAEVGRKRDGILTPMMVEMKILPEHFEDVLLYAERHLQPAEDGSGFFAVEGVANVTSGNTPKDWLTEMVERRPGWLPPSVGGGARGGARGATGGGPNPWTSESWHMGEQGKIFTERGPEAAKRLAEAAGTTVGGLRPMAAKR